MRDLINKLTLLESGGTTLSIPAIAKLLSTSFDKKGIQFFVSKQVNLIIDLTTGPVTVTEFRLINNFDIDDAGHLKYRSLHNEEGALFLMIFDSLDVKEKLDIDPLRNQMIIGYTAISEFRQMFNVDITRYINSDNVIYHRNLNAAGVQIQPSREFLALLDDAYQWRQENIGDLP